MHAPPIMDMEDEVDRLVKEIAELHQIINQLKSDVEQLVRQRDEALIKIDELIAVHNADA